MAASVKSGARSSAARSLGTILWKPSGTGTRRPAGWSAVESRIQILRASSLDGISSPARPSSVASSRAQGLAETQPSGPHSTVKPPSRTVSIRPPRRFEASNSTASTGAPARAWRAISYAAVRPAMPPPIMATRFITERVQGTGNREQPSSALQLDIRGNYVDQGLGEEWRVVQGFGTVEAQAERAGGLSERDVDVVENLDIVAEKADGLQNDSRVAFVTNCLQRVLDRGADPRASGDSLALEGEEPRGQRGKPARGGREDELGGALGLDRVRIGSDLHWRSRPRAGDAGFAGHNRPARNRVRGEEDGQRGFPSSLGTGARVDRGEALGEGLDEGWLVGPLFDEGDVEAVGDGHQGAAVEADADR